MKRNLIIDRCLVITQRNYNGERVSKKAITPTTMKYAKLDAYRFFKTQAQLEIMGVKA